MSLAKLRNLGPVSARWLGAVGIARADDLERLGAARAFAAVRASGTRASWNLLYALHGAIYDLPWNDLPEALRARLRAEAEALERSADAR